MAKIISILTLTLTGLVTFGRMNFQEKSNMDKKIVYDFVNAINEHNVEKIYSLMTDDHTFVDAHGNERLSL
jgi:hypothetical protein